ncbi:MAG: F-type H+-transporting ATPase subunit b [Candidatus Peregrinibacteria bacterium Greene1014_49]|nr:MAG: F-type H+-transporting ATPase subunit b [Candidatus Peregrinibacteria bacterium Greene1014_49]
MELLNALGIDLGVLISQLINYGILLVALTVLLYRPILKLLDERKDRIAKSMEDSKKIEHQLKEMETSRKAAMKELDQKSSALLAEAKKQADTSRSELMKAAEQEVSALLERGKKQLEDEKRKMVADLEKTVAKVTVALAGKILEREFTPADQSRLLSSLQKDIPALIQ